MCVTNFEKEKFENVWKYIYNCLITRKIDYVF